MIGKMTKGKSHGGALKYDLLKKGAKLIATNCATSNWREIAMEMDTVAASNDKCKIHCLHLSISAPNKEHLNDYQWIQVGHIAMESLDLTDHQYVITRHIDTDHDHIHICINRINFNGHAWNDSLDYKRVHQAMRNVEKTMNLQQLENYEINENGRFHQVKKDFDQCVTAASDMGINVLENEMKLRGYTIIKNLSQKTGLVSGISIQSDHDHKIWKSRELKKGGYKSIEQKLGSSIEQKHKKYNYFPIHSKIKNKNELTF